MPFLHRPSWRHAAGWLVLASLVACHRSASSPPATAGGELAEARAVRFVKLEEVSEWNGNPWAAVAELNLIDSTGTLVDRSRWTVTADSAGISDGATNAIDGDPKSHWHSQWEGAEAPPPPPHWLVVALPTPVRVSGFRYLPRQDGTANGSIARYRFHVSDDGVDWGEPVSTDDFTTKGDAAAEKTVIFAKQTGNHPPVVASLAEQTSPMGVALSTRVEATDADGDPLVFGATGLPTGLSIDASSGTIVGTPIVAGSYRAVVSVTDGKGSPVTSSSTWIVGPPAGTGAATPLSPGEVRFVRLEALTERNGKPWAAIAEFNVFDKNGTNLPRIGWVASADSADASDQAANAIDGQPTTIWHSKWDGVAPPPPHSLVIDLKAGARIGGFRYLPRQDSLQNGTIARFRFHASVDGVDWGSPLAEGDFSTMGPPDAEKTVRVR